MYFSGTFLHQNIFLEGNFSICNNNPDETLEIS